MLTSFYEDKVADFLIIEPPRYDDDDDDGNDDDDNGDDVAFSIVIVSFLSFVSFLF